MIRNHRKPGGIQGTSRGGHNQRPIGRSGDTEEARICVLGGSPKAASPVGEKEGKIGNEGLGEVGHARDLERRPNPRENT